MKPILFNTEMVKAILGWSKTQTRRLLKPKYQSGEDSFQIITNAHSGKFIRVEYCDEYGNETRWMPPPCEVGDILWVRETHFKDAGRYMYFANYAKDEKFYRDGQEVKIRWVPSIHMPKEAARIFLRVKGVRVERLQDITLMDAMAEGCYGAICKHIDANPELGCTDCYNTGWLERPDHEFAQLWDTTIKPDDLQEHGWEANPWVWVIEFERCEKPKEW